MRLKQRRQGPIRLKQNIIIQEQKIIFFDALDCIIIDLRIIEFSWRIDNNELIRILYL